jgi:hypothetical protein
MTPSAVGGRERESREKKERGEGEEIERRGIGLEKM